MSVYDQIYYIVCQIPEGMVCTYGQVARLAGNPRLARTVGNALHQNPAFGKIPCHRVVNRDGRLAPAYAFGGPAMQRSMLEAEGVVLTADGRVDLTKYGWYGLE